MNTINSIPNEIIEWVRNERSKGNTVIPRDNPLELLRGFSSFSENDSEEKMETKTWPIRPELTDIKIDCIKCDHKYFFSCFSSASVDNLLLCDNPNERLLGFIILNEDTLICRTLTISEFKSASLNRVTGQDVEYFMSVRSELMSRSKIELENIYELTS
jgi:hypothetical protein